MRTDVFSCEKNVNNYKCIKVQSNFGEKNHEIYR